MILKKKHSLFSLVLPVFVLSTLIIFIYSEGGSQNIQKNEEYYNEMGMVYYNKGFYDITPKNKKEEASQYFEQAITAFKTAIAINNDFVQAHRNLARVYYVQKRYSEAADQYRKVTDLNPSDIDAYIITALAYVKMQKYAEAIERLEVGRAFAADEAVIQKLDDYINRVEEEKRLR